MRLNVRIITAIALCLGTALTLGAQDGTYSGYTPYSIFGLGDLSVPGSAYNAALGGTGIATRSHKTVNYLNPAAVTARDSLSFMADFNLKQVNKIYSQGGSTSANNTFNIESFALSFPLFRNTAMMVGMAPYSNTGYSFYTTYDTPAIMGSVGDVYATSTGQGSIYQLFIGGGVTIARHLSVGAQWNHYFGSIVKQGALVFGESGYNGINNGYTLKLGADSYKLGLQYETRVGALDLCAGATYTSSAALRGYVEDYQFSSGSVVTDTLHFSRDTLGKTANASLASELGFGLSFGKRDKWRAEVNYTRSDWTKSGMKTTTGFASSGVSSFTPTVRQAWRGGFEFTPNINDIRYYFRRCTYRAGAYFESAYYKLDGNAINSFGITLGATLPFSRMNNGITVAADLGQRASLKGNNIRERYIGFTIGFNTYDIWFLKPRYD